MLRDTAKRLQISLPIGVFDPYEEGGSLAQGTVLFLDRIETKRFSQLMGTLLAPCCCTNNRRAGVGFQGRPLRDLSTVDFMRKPWDSWDCTVHLWSFDLPRWTRGCRNKTHDKRDSWEIHGCFNAGNCYTEWRILSVVQYVALDF